MKSKLVPFLLFALLGFASPQNSAPSSNSQSAPPPSTQSTSPSTPPSEEGQGPAGRQQPCWEQAGLSRSILQEHRQIQQNMRRQVMATCSDPALSQEQRVLKIREIQEQTRKELAGLMTPEQEQALNNCRAQRGGGRRPAAGIMDRVPDCAALSGGTARQHATPTSPQQRPQQPQQQPSQDQDPN